MSRAWSRRSSPAAPCILHKPCDDFRLLRRAPCHADRLDRRLAVRRHAPRPAFALESAPVSSARAVVTLVSDTDSVTAGTPGKPTGAFDSGFFAKDGSFSFTFATPGTYDYFCKRHPSMKARVTVTE